MLLLRNIFIILIFIVSFVGPYKAFLNSEHSESFIEIIPGDSMYAVMSKLASDSLPNKLFFKIYANKNNINCITLNNFKEVDNVSQFKNFQSPVCKDYKVNKTPAFFILDREMKIVNKPKGKQELMLFLKNNM